MEKERQVKLLSIIALVVAIAGMTLGFAAFSTTLNISSSATVTPNSSDFKINVYGFEDYESIEQFLDSGFSIENINLSSTTAAGLAQEAESTFLMASIDNNSHTISNLQAQFTLDKGMITYPLIIKNEGKYDAYIDLSDFLNDSVLSKEYGATCFAGEGASEELVEKACNGLKITFGIIDKNTGDGKVINENFYKIPVNTFELFAVIIEYSSTPADGPFTAKFPEFKLNFSTAQ